MNYSDFVSTLANLLQYNEYIVDPASATPSSFEPFNQILPSIITYAENRIQRDMELLTDVITDNTGVLNQFLRSFALPTDVGTFLIVEEARLQIGGVYTAPLTWVSRQVIDTIYPSDGAPFSGAPIYAAMQDAATILLGPCPDIAYPIQIVGTQRVNELSATNTSNWLTLWLPDIYIAAAMIAAAGWQRDVAANAQTPGLTDYWEGQYKTLIQDANVEEFRKRRLSVGATTKIPNPLMPQG